MIGMLMNNLFIKSNIIQILVMLLNYRVVCKRSNDYYLAKTNVYRADVIPYRSDVIRVNKEKSTIAYVERVGKYGTDNTDALREVLALSKTLSSRVIIMFDNIPLSISGFYDIMMYKRTYTVSDITLKNIEYMRSINNTSRSCDIFIYNDNKLLQLGHLENVTIKFNTKALQDSTRLLQLYFSQTYKICADLDWDKCILDASLNNTIEYKKVKELNIFKIDDLFFKTLLKYYNSSLDYCDPCTAGFMNAVRSTAEELNMQDAFVQYENLDWESSDDYNFYLLMNLKEFTRNNQNGKAS